VIQLLHGIPTWGRDVTLELTTPTGAAILAGMATSFGALPPLRITASGFGAGRADIDGLLNCTQVVVGEALADSPVPGQPVVLLEANLDDATGEVLAHSVEALLEAGAHDAWITPILMKKGRPGHTVSALVDLARVDPVRRALQSETGTLGVRGATLERWPASRSVSTVVVEGLPVHVKVSPGRVKVEQGDAAFVAARTGIPLREVLQRAEWAWRHARFPRSDGGPGVADHDHPDQPTPA
jgi:hypothetical protein